MVFIADTFRGANDSRPEAGPARTIALDGIDVGAAKEAHVTDASALANFARAVRVIDLSAILPVAPQSILKVEEPIVPPQFCGPVLVFLNYTENEATSCEFLEARRAHGLSADVTVVCADELSGMRYDRLERTLARREYSLVIEINPQSSRASALDGLEKISHIPPIVRFSDSSALHELLSSPDAWADYRNRYHNLLPPSQENLLGKWNQEACALSPGLLEVALTASPEQSHPSYNPQRTLDTISALIASRNVALAEGDPWSPAQGFAARYAPEDLRHLLESPGARLVILTQGELILSYYLFFVDPANLPPRGAALVKALTGAAEVLPPGNTGYAKITENTPVGQKWARIHGVNLYDLSHRMMVNDAESSGLGGMVAECRLFPHPNEAALRAHQRVGWRETSTAIMSTPAKNVTDIAAGAVLHLTITDQQASTTARPSLEDAAQQALAKAPITLDLRQIERARSFAMWREVRAHPMDRDALLKAFGVFVQDTPVANVWIGNGDNTREILHIHRQDPGEIRIDARVWDKNLTSVIYQHTVRLSPYQALDIFNRNLLQTYHLLLEGHKLIPTRAPN
jgi:hypothetical protein